MTDLLQLPKSLLSNIQFSEYKSGTKIGNGNIVKNVLSKSGLHVVYQVEGKRGIAYEYVAPNHEVQNIIKQITSIIYLSEERFFSTASDEIGRRVAPIFHSIFTENIPCAKEQIKELEDYVNRKLPVKKIIFESYDYTIWIDSENNSRLFYQQDGVASQLNNVIAEYLRVRAIGSSFLSKKQRGDFSEQLSAALAFSLKSSKNNTAPFKESELLVSKIIENSLRTKYSIFTLLTAITIILSLIIIVIYSDLPDSIKMCIYTVSGGVIGAFISVQERVKKIKCQVSDPVWTLVFQAIIRIVLGGVFGFIAFIASKTGIAFSFFNESSMTLIFLGILSGFSERLIPELLQSLEKKKQDVN